MMKFILEFLILISLPIIAVAQNASSLSEPQITYIKNERLQVRFDPAQNQTSVFIYPFIGVNPGYNESIGVMAITAGYIFTGQNKTSIPQSVLLRVYSLSGIGWQFADEKERTIEITVNGESLLTGKLELLTTSKKPVDSKYGDKSAPNYREEFQYYEYLGITLSYGDFMKIVNGKKVIIKTGRKKLKLDEEHFDAFRVLVQRMKG